MIEALCNIPSHLHVLNLISPDRHFMRIEYEDVCGHQYRIGKQPHSHSEIWVLPGHFVGLHCGLIGMRSIHKTLGSRATQYPTELGNFGDVGLSVEKCFLWVEPECQPRCGNLSA